MAVEFDILIAGLGAMGSATAFHLAKRGRRVLGLDRFSPPHTNGSSHGRTRIIREAYFEHPLYVPLVQRAYELWAGLEKESGRKLWRQTGGLMIGRADGLLVSGARRSAEEHRLAHELLSAAQIRQRFPALRPSDEMMAVWEPRAGILFPEACIETHLELARRHGADLRFDDPVMRWEADGAGVRVFTTHGEYHAARLLLTAGSWISSLVPELKLPFTVERQVQFWFEVKPGATSFAPERCPIHLWEYEPRRFFYGFPDLGDGVKIALHHEGASAQPDTLRREVGPEEVAAMRALTRRFVPEADGPLRAATVCMYTNTPDEHFWIDAHPQFPQVVIASPCSGHGFKFSSVMGEILSDLLMRGESRFDLSLFRQRAPMRV